jgi:hypothetical protein
VREHVQRPHLPILREIIRPQLGRPLEGLDKEGIDALVVHPAPTHHAGQAITEGLSRRRRIGCQAALEGRRAQCAQGRGRLQGQPVEEVVVLQAPQQDGGRPRLPKSAQAVDRVEQGPLRLGLLIRQSGLQAGGQRRDPGGPGGQALLTEGLGQCALLDTEVPDEGMKRQTVRAECL